MVAKKKRAASKPKARSAKAHGTSKKGGRPKKHRGKGSKPRPSPKKSSPGGKDRAAMMAAFSAKVLEEEEAPVAVRSFIEARQGVEASKELNVKTGSTAPADEVEPVDEEDDDEEVPTFKAAPPPKIEPLAGPASVPRKRDDEEFRIATPPKKGKKAEAPTKEGLGKIELRMQRGSGDATIGHASPDYLQRSFNRAKESGRVTGAGSRKEPGKPKGDAFEVATDKPSAPKDASLLDFGDVEIAQQTRSGRKKLGKLDTDEDDER